MKLQTSLALAIAVLLIIGNARLDAQDPVADADGHFRLAQIPIGRYSNTVEAPHFATLVQQPITVDISQNVRLQFTLAAI